MRRKLFIAAIAGAGGAAAGALFSALSLQVVGSLSDETKWLIEVSAGLGTFAGASIGWICAATHAQTGGRPAKTLAVVAIAFLLGIVVARRLFGHAPGGMQLLLAVAGAVIASIALRLWARMISPASAAPRPPRSWRFQFTLATLLTMLTLVSIGLALYVRGPVRRYQVAKEIERTGGRVRYGSQAPSWVVDLLGDVSRGFFNTVTEIDMHANGDADLRQLHIFSQLRSLRLRGAEVTDDGMKFIGELRALDELDLGGLNLTDAAIEHLKRLTQLRSLTLPPGVTGAGLARLAPLSNLEYLGFTGTIQDTDLRRLPPLRRLRQLQLFRASITDVALENVGELVSLEDLVLSWTPITDAGLEKLQRLTRLKRLSLSKTNITDAGLKHLGAMQQLEHLDLVGTQVTGTGLGGLEGLDQLHRLWLGGSITDQGLQPLGRITCLKMLIIESKLITDDGLAGLSTLRSLEHLRLSSSAAITDAGLVHLECLPRLRYLDTSNTAVTSAGLERWNHIMEQKYGDRATRANDEHLE